MVAPPSMMPPPGMAMPGMAGMTPPAPPAPPPAPPSRAARAAARLKPYQLAERRRPRLGGDGQPLLDEYGQVEYAAPRRPTKTYITRQKEQRVKFWKGRNEEIDQDFALILMEAARDEKAGAGPGGEENIYRATAAAMVLYIANLVSLQEDSISVAPRAEVQPYRDAAQDIEDFLVDGRREVDAKHAARGMPGYAYTEGWFAASEGWLVSRNYLDPGRRFPLCSELFDARHCYPEFTDSDTSQLRSMLYTERTTIDAFLAANPRLADRPAFREYRDGGENEDADTAAPVEVIWYEDEHWSVLIVDDGDPEYVEHGYGFCPWLAIPMSGSPLMDAQHRRHHGIGVVRWLRHILRYQDRLASQTATLHAKDANPAYVAPYDSSKGGTPVQIDTSPGTGNPADIAKGQGYQPIMNQDRPDRAAYLQKVSDEDVDNLGVPALLRGTQIAINSGFQFNALRQQAEIVLKSYSKGIIAHRQWQHRLWLNLILVAERDGLLEPNVLAEIGGQGMAGVAFRRPNRAPGANAYASDQPKTVYSVLTPEAIHLNGVESEVKLDNMTPQDYAQNGQVAGMLVEMGVLDPETAMSKLLGIHDWDTIRDKIIYYQFMKLPEVIQNYLGPEVLRRIDPGAYEFMRSMQQQQAQQAMMAQGPPGAPTGSAPAPSPGLDSTALPPQMQAVTGQPGGDAQGLQALIASLAQQAPPGGD